MGRGRARNLAFGRDFKLRGKERLPVTTYRCHRCGYLESYAEAD